MDLVRGSYVERVSWALVSKSCLFVSTVTYIKVNSSFVFAFPRAASPQVLESAVFKRSPGQLETGPTCRLLRLCIHQVSSSSIRFRMPPKRIFSTRRSSSKSSTHGTVSTIYSLSALSVRRPKMSNPHRGPGHVFSPDHHPSSSGMWRRPHPLRSARIAVRPAIASHSCPSASLHI